MSPQTPAGPLAAPNIESDKERSLAAYFDAFSPAPEWSELPRWPPDVFALANLVLDHTGAYRFVVAPPPGKHWPPIRDWGAQMRSGGRAWREATDGTEGELPPLVRRNWGIVTRCRDVSLATIRSGEAAELIGALLTLHAMADEACADIAASGRRTSPPCFEALGWSLLQEHGSLSRIAPTRVRIVPKNHFSTRGMTIRSLSRYLALCYEAVDLKWGSIGPGPSAERDDYNIVLVPWPLSVKSSDFGAVSSALLENMDPELFGFFEFAPEPSLDYDLFAALLAAAGDRVERVDAVIFPESAIHPEAIADLECILADHGAAFLIAGVRGAPEASMGRNYLHFGVRMGSGWRRYEQDKHHRWCLDEQQIRQYHLSRSLTPKKLWWEAIHVGERRLHVVDVGGGATTVPTVCEDLASLDEVAEMVRQIGPSLVVAILLDGPQLATRWPSRYSSVLTNDPGAAVLTLTSYGMAARSRPPGRPASHVVAHWNSPTDGLHEIELAPRASAVVMSTSVEKTTAWTADGRRHDDVPTLALSGVDQLRV